MSNRSSGESCPVCGGEAQLVSEKRSFTIRKRMVEADDRFYRCPGCNEEFYLPGMMDDSLRRATARIREEDGLLTPDQVLAIRKRLGLTQPDFERLLGLGANTVVRWERGTVPQSAGTDSLLRVVDTFPEVARFLSARTGVGLGSPPEGTMRSSARTARHQRSR